MTEADPSQHLTPPWTTRAKRRLALFQGAFIAGVTAQKAASNALFLSRADPEQLPLLYVGVALVVAALTTLLARLLVTRSAARLLPAFVLVDAVFLAVFAVGAEFGSTASAAALYVVAEAGTTAISILFWARVTDAFGARDQRRVIGAISAAGMFGAMVGGGIVTVVAPQVGVPLTVVVSALWAPIALIFLTRVRDNARKMHASDEAANVGDGLRYLVGRGLPRALAVLVVLVAATGALVDYLFRVSTAGAFSEVEMASAFGILNAVVGVVAAVAQATLTAKLLTRVGVFWFAAIIPSGLLLLAAVQIGFPLAAPLGLLFALKAVEMLGAYSFNNTAITLLYNPMPEAVRTQVRALIDGTVKKLGAAVAGIALLVLIAFLSRTGVLVVTVAMCAMTLALLPALRTAYLTALDEKLGRRRKKRTQTPVVVTNRESLAVVTRALESNDVARVLVAMRTLAKEAALPRELIGAMLNHASDDVCQEALRHLPRAKDDALARQLLTLARRRDARDSARGAAVLGLARAAPGNATSWARTLLLEESAPVRMTAIEVILRENEDEEARAILDQQVATLGEAPPSVRRAVARLLGALDESRYDAALVALIHDDDERVRTRAVAAAGREQHEAHVDPLIASLSDALVRPFATAALAAYGDTVVPALAAAIDDAGRPLSQRRHLPRVLARIGGVASANALLRARPRDEAALQRTCVERLVEILRENPTVPLNDDARHDAIERRMRLSSAYRDAVRDLETFGPEQEREGHAQVTSLKRLLNERQDQSLRLAHLLIGLGGNMDRAMAAYRALSPLGVGASSRRRQDGLELLEHVLAGDRLKQDFVRAVEETPTRAREGAGVLRLDELLASPDPLARGLAAQAAHAIGRPVREISRVRATLSGAEDLDINGDDMDESILNRAVALDHTDMFEGLSLDDLAVIATVAKDRTLEPGAEIYRQGDVGESLYLVQSGRVDLFKDDRFVMTLEEGESAGQVSFLDRGPRPVTARVSPKGPARVLSIERGDLMDLFADRPALMQTFFGVVGARLRALLE